MNSTYWVTMTDKAMSHWDHNWGGKPVHLIDKIVIECETYEIAQRIASSAEQRENMIYVNIRTTKPYYGAGYNVTEHTPSWWRL